MKDRDAHLRAGRAARAGLLAAIEGLSSGQEAERGIDPRLAR